MSNESAESAIEAIYEANEGNEVIESYAERHEIKSLMILTVTCQQAAELEVKRIRRAIKGKRVIEIGAGVGFLAIEMARHAQSVVAIEADAAWSWVFTAHLYAYKPRNLTFIFGNAQSVSNWMRGDVAVVYTRSDINGMEDIAKVMCPLVIRGPRLSLEERYPTATKEEIELAEAFSSTVTLDDIVSRRGISGTKLKDMIP